LKHKDTRTLRVGGVVLDNEGVRQPLDHIVNKDVSIASSS